MVRRNRGRGSCGTHHTMRAIGQISQTMRAMRNTTKPHDDSDWMCVCGKGERVWLGMRRVLNRRKHAPDFQSYVVGEERDVEAKWAELPHTQ